MKDKSIVLDLIALNGTNPKALGKLEEYQLPLGKAK